MGSLQGKEVVVQGVGTVGLALIRQLLARNVGRLVAADTNKEAVDHAARLLEGQPLELRLVPAEDMSILAERCDVLAPNGWHSRCASLRDRRARAHRERAPAWMRGAAGGRDCPQPSGQF